MANTERKTPKYHKVLFGPLSVPGVLLGAVLMAFSFGPSLLPREPMMQGVLGALSFTFGYALGVLVWFLVRWVAKLIGKPIQEDCGPAWLRLPIRVYGGLKSAESTDARAQLVVDGLNRTNAADRAVVALVSTTGTDWVDPIAAATIEYMYNGDTAIAAMQYSFLPSWISFILDTATATDAGVAINTAVIEWWDGLPVDNRPRLIAFGESLGTLGSEAAYAQDSLDASLGFVQSNVEGAFWVGPTDANEIHGQYTAGRNPSPVWKPVYNDGAIVRTFNGPGEFDAGGDLWEEPRIVYYHHPSDPVGYWNWETLWQPQQWTDKPVGHDVPDSVRWVPFTTFTQVVVDLINGFSASVGHGHNYNDVFVDGWSVVAPPAGWTSADTDRLEAHIAPLDLPGL